MVTERFVIAERPEQLVLTFNTEGRLAGIEVQREGKTVCDVILALEIAGHVGKAGWSFLEGAGERG